MSLIVIDSPERFSQFNALVSEFVIGPIDVNHYAKGLTWVLNWQQRT